MQHPITILLAIAVLSVAGCAGVQEPAQVCMDVKDGVSSTRAEEVSLAVLVAQRGPDDEGFQCYDPSRWINPAPGSIGDLLARQIASRGFHIAPAVAVPAASADVIHRPYDCGADLEPYFNACAADVLLVGEAIITASETGSVGCRAEVSLAAYRRTDKKRLFTVYSYVDGGRAGGTCGDVVARLSREAAEEVLGRFFVDGEQDHG